jgi:ABC-type transport system involved in multi-copper enzyme maturation permease subunit
MMHSLKAEFRKLYTVRSTYVLIAVSVIIIMLLAGYAEGVRATVLSLRYPHMLEGESTSAVSLIGLLMAIAGMLLVGHEYRYNTIMYTLTSSNKRLKPFFAKVIVVSIFALLMGLFVTFFSPLSTIIGVRLSGHHLVHQNFNYFSIIWRCVFCVWGYAMYGLVLAYLIRSQVGTIVTYLLIPIIGETILGVLLKGNFQYLPFTGLQSVTSPRVAQGITSGQGALVACLYIIVGLSVAAYLFLRRDAN